MMEFAKRLGEILGIILLFLGGLGGVLFASFHLFHFWPSITEKIEPSWAVLGILGLLSLAMGIERIVHFLSLEKKLVTIESSIERLLSRSPAGKVVKGKKDLYDSVAIPLVSRANRRICALIFAESPKAPPEYAKAIAKRLKELEKGGAPGQFDTVVVINPKKLPANYETLFSERRKIYQDAGVGTSVRLFFLEAELALGFDLLLIDDEHAIVAFSPVYGTAIQQTAIVFENDPMVVGEMNSWFDQKVLPEGIPADEWLGNAAKRAQHQSG